MSGGGPRRTAPPVATATAAARWRRWTPVALPYALVGVLFVVGGLRVDGFASWPSVRSILVLAAFLGIASVGQTLTIIIGGIDLSIPALITVGNVVTIQLLGRGWSFGAAMLVVFGAAIAAGILNGGLSRLLGAHPLIVTLATGSIVSGAVLATGQNVSAGNVPTWLTKAVSPGGSTFGIDVPTIVIVWLVIVAAIVGLQGRTSFGKRLYASGANPNAARFSRINLTAVWIATYIVSAICGAVTGVLLAGFAGGADPNIGAPYLFNTVAAVVVGGTSLLGGAGGYGRSVAGALAITILTTILLGEGLNEQVQQILLGVVIVVVVGFYGRQTAIRDQI